jgi:hypothetical protein
MATSDLSDAELLAFLHEHPELRSRFASIVRAVENSDGDLAEADAAEDRLVEEMRLLGRDALQGWAARRVDVTEQEIRQEPQMHRQGKKSPLAHEIRRNSGLGAAISVRHAAGAAVPEPRESQSLRLFAPPATGDRRFRR